MSDKKTPQEASNLFHNIMKASVTPKKTDGDKEEKKSFKVQGWNKKSETESKKKD